MLDWLLGGGKEVEVRYLSQLKRCPYPINGVYKVHHRAARNHFRRHADIKHRGRCMREREREKERDRERESKSHAVDLLLQRITVLLSVKLPMTRPHYREQADGRSFISPHSYKRW